MLLLDEFHLVKDAGPKLLKTIEEPPAGTFFVVLADALARTLVAPAEMPIGVLTALVGGPFFLWLLTQRRGERR